MAKRFNRVDAFDFSPKMIEQAQKRKKAEDKTNILFSVADIEYEQITDEDGFRSGDRGQIDLVVASFGMGSFVEDTRDMLRRFHGWMSDEGKRIISFYNSACITMQVLPQWRDTSLAAKLDLDSNTLRVELSSTAVFHIFCKAYTAEILHEVKSIFEVERIVSFPTTMSLLPNDLLSNPLSEKLFSAVDEKISEDETFRLGHYITIVARKSPVPLGSYERIIATLDAAKMKYEVLTHKPVKSISDAAREIGWHDHAMMKTVVFAERRRKSADRIIFAVISAERRIDEAKLAAAAKTTQNKIFQASEKDLMELGFPIGGVAPLGAKISDDALYLIDEETLQKLPTWVYMGVGDTSKTLKLRTTDFKRLIKNTYKVLPL